MVFALVALPARTLADEAPWYHYNDDDAPLSVVAEEEPVESDNEIPEIRITNLNTNFINDVKPWWDTKLDTSVTNGRHMSIIWERWYSETGHSFVGPDAYFNNPANGAPRWNFTYQYEVQIQVDEGYEIPQDVTVTINGKDCSAVVVGPYQAPFRFFYLYVDFNVQSSQPVPLYRMYNTKTSEHLWTRNKKEYDSAGTGNYADWKAEGVAWYVPKQSAKPVYRLYNTKSGDHHYTTSAAERDKLVGSGQWRDEGIAFYSATAKDKESIRIYRVYNSRLKRGQHHYTKSAAERDSLVKNSGWKDEGVGFYGYGKATVTPDPEYAQH